MNFEVLGNIMGGSKQIHDFMSLTFPFQSKEQLLRLISKCEKEIVELLELKEKVARPAKDKENKNLEEHMGVLSMTLNGVQHELSILLNILNSYPSTEEINQLEEEKGDLGSKNIYSAPSNIPSLIIVLQSTEKVLCMIYPMLESSKKKYSTSSLIELWILCSRISTLMEILQSAKKANSEEIYFQDQESKKWKDLKPYFQVQFDFSDKFEKAFTKFYNKHYSWAASCSQYLFSTKSEGGQFAKTMGGLLWYGAFKSKAKILAERFLKNPTPNQVKRYWNSFTENKYISKVGQLGGKSVKCLHEIYLPKLLPKLTERMLAEQSMYSVEGAQSPTDIFIQYGVNPAQYNPEKNVKVQLIWKNQFILDKESQILMNKDNLDPEIVMIYIHGGGWLSGNGKSPYLRKWSDATNLLIFSIEYSLSPEFKFPGPLDDCWQAYYWIVTQATVQLGINPKVLILAGDSAGANLAAALCLRAIHCRVRKPTGLILGYPALFCTLDIFRPSMLLSIDDSLLRYSILERCYESYVKEGTEVWRNPFISPALMDDADLAQFPPTRILACGRDPLRDEAYYFLHRMVSVHVADVFLEELRMFPHGVWSLSGWIQGFKQCELGNHIAVTWIRQFITQGLQDPHSQRNLMMSEEELEEEKINLLPAAQEEEIKTAEDKWEMLRQSEVQDQEYNYLEQMSGREKKASPRFHTERHSSPHDIWGNSDRIEQSLHNLLTKYSLSGERSPNILQEYRAQEDHLLLQSLLSDVNAHQTEFAILFNKELKKVKERVGSVENVQRADNQRWLSFDRFKSIIERNFTPPGQPLYRDNYSTGDGNSYQAPIIYDTNKNIAIGREGEISNQLKELKEEKTNIIKEREREREHISLKVNKNTNNTPSKYIQAQPPELKLLKIQIKKLKALNETLEHEKLQEINKHKEYLIQAKVCENQAAEEIRLKNDTFQFQLSELKINILELQNKLTISESKLSDKTSEIIKISLENKDLHTKYEESKKLNELSNDLKNISPESKNCVKCLEYENEINLIKIELDKAMIISAENSLGEKNTCQKSIEDEKIKYENMIVSYKTERIVLMDEAERLKVQITSLEIANKELLNKLSIYENNEREVVNNVENVKNKNEELIIVYKNERNGLLNENGKLKEIITKYEVENQELLNKQNIYQTTTAEAERVKNEQKTFEDQVLSFNIEKDGIIENNQKFQNQIKQIQTENEDLIKKLTTYKTNETEYQSEKHTLSLMLEKQKSEIENLRTENESLLNKIYAQNDLLRAKEKELSNNEYRISEISSEIDLKSAQLQLLEDKYTNVYVSDKECEHCANSKFEISKKQIELDKITTQLTDLKIYKIEIEDKLFKNTNKYDKLNIQNEELIVEKDNLIKKINIYEDQEMKMRAIEEELTRCEEKLRNELNLQNKNLNEAKKELESKASENTKMLEMLKQEKGKIENLELKMNSLNEENSILIEEINKLKENKNNSEELLSKIKEQENDRKVYIGKIEELNNQLNNMKNESLASSSLSESAEEEKVNLKEEIISLNSELTKRQQKVQNLENMNANINKSKQNLTKNLGAMTKDKLGIEKKLKQMEKELETSAKLSEDLKGEVAELKEKEKYNYEKLEEKIEELTKANRILVTKVQDFGNLEMACHKMAEEKQTLTFQKESLVKEINGFKSSKGTMNNMDFEILEQFKLKIKQIEAEKTDLASKNEGLKIENENLKQMKNGTEGENNMGEVQMKIKLEHMNTINLNLQTTIQKLTQDSKILKEEFKVKVDRMSIDNGKYKIENEDLNSYIAKAKKEIAQINKESANNKKLKDNLTKKIADQSITLMELRENETLLQQKIYDLEALGSKKTSKKPKK